MTSLQQCALSHCSHKWPPLGDGRCLRHPSWQGADRGDNACNDQPVDVAISQVACCIEREAHAAVSNFLDRREALRKNIGDAIRVDQTRQHFFRQNYPPCSSLAAQGRGKCFRARVPGFPFAFGETVNNMLLREAGLS